MSRIANYPVDIPEKVEIKVDYDKISVKRPLGTLTQAISPKVKIERVENRLEFKVNDNSRQANALSGTTRAIVANMVTGVTKGFEKKLNLVGVDDGDAALGAIHHLVSDARLVGVWPDDRWRWIHHGGHSRIGRTAQQELDRHQADNSPALQHDDVLHRVVARIDQ